MLEVAYEVGGTLHEMLTVLQAGMLEKVHVAKADPVSRSVFDGDPDRNSDRPHRGPCLPFVATQTGVIILRATQFLDGH